MPDTFVTLTAPPAGEGIDLSGIASGLTSLRSAFGQVTSFTGATSATLLPLVGALSAVRSAVGVAVRSSETTLGGSQGAVGGVVAGGAPATYARFWRDTGKKPLACKNSHGRRHRQADSTPTRITIADLLG